MNFKTIYKTVSSSDKEIFDEELNKLDQLGYTTNSSMTVLVAPCQPPIYIYSVLMSKTVKV